MKISNFLTFCKKIISVCALLSFSSISSIAVAERAEPFECPQTPSDNNKYDYQFSGSAIIIKKMPTETNPIGYADGYCFYKPTKPGVNQYSYKAIEPTIRITNDDLQIYNSVSPDHVWEKKSVVLPFFDGFNYLPSDYVCGTVLSSKPSWNWVSVNSIDPRLCKTLSKAEIKDTYKANFLAMNPIKNEPLLVKCYKSNSNMPMACNAFFDADGENQPKLYQDGGSVYISNQIDKVNIVWNSGHEMDGDAKKTCLGLSKEQLQSSTITLTWDAAGFFTCSPAGDGK